ncbi:hypothetical protein IEO70_04390 [Bacillus sp. AGMB 02131]|uniref:YqfQ-like protein n=1 Tax=Peribacillus faecalis TaxID=2772559 RepID=A0A927CTJ8_9BACI|nr:VrrA/YqfQ family protein [Peribacillus faecalis]MBD3107597.1 hypothetical protein [Peribacillus faecalis]
MNRMYNQMPRNQFMPNQYPVQQPMTYNMNYYPNNTQQMPPPYPLQQQYQPGGNYRQYPNRPPSQSYMMPPRQGFNEPPEQEKKGFLSKLFRNSNKQPPPPAPTAQSLFSLPSDNTRGAASAATAAAESGGILQSIVNPANLTNMLNNTQKVLQAAESFGPLVQQYGPMVKNIPSVWKVIQGLGSKEDEQQKSENREHTAVASPLKSEQAPIPEQKPITQHQPHIKPPSPIQGQNRSSRRYAPGESIPRLFV